MDRRQDWFERGCEAYKHVTRQLGVQLPCERFYVCPLCFTGFNELALSETVDQKQRLTDEHVPPASVGGNKMTLTCAACNSDAGAEM